MGISPKHAQRGHFGLFAGLKIDLAFELDWMGTIIFLQMLERGCRTNINMGSLYSYYDSMIRATLFLLHRKKDSYRATVSGIRAS